MTEYFPARFNGSSSTTPTSSPVASLRAPLTQSALRLSGSLVSEAFSRLQLFAGADIAFLTQFTLADLHDLLL